jgi:glucoamylase
LVWAHSEYIKLLRSLHDGKAWDLPPQTVHRYQVEQRTATFQIWTPLQKRRRLAHGKDLRIDLTGAATIGWESQSASGSLRTYDTNFGVHCATLPCSELEKLGRITIRIEPDDPASDSVQAQTFVIRLGAN